MNKCYTCTNRRDIPGNCHSSCVALGAKVTGNAYGIQQGWFFWPFNFDPTWLETCDSYDKKDTANG